MKSLFVLVIGDGYLCAAGEDPSLLRRYISYFSADGEQEWAIYQTRRLPAALKKQLEDQGTGDQWFDDGYVALDVARGFIESLWGTSQEDLEILRVLHRVPKEVLDVSL